MLSLSRMPLEPWRLNSFSVCERTRLANDRQQSIAYSQCWEDADVLLAAFALPCANGKEPATMNSASAYARTLLPLANNNPTILSVISGGENTLALLTLNPKKIIAIDSSLPQIFCLQLKIAAFALLSYEELLEFLGALPSPRRDVLYMRCRKNLTGACLVYWDQHISWIKKGILNSGRLDRYFSLFRSYVLPLIHSPKIIQELLLLKNEPEQLLFFERHWHSWRWRLLFPIFFSRAVMSLLGRDPAKFKFVEKNWAESLAGRINRGLVATVNATNPYLNWILTGSYGVNLPFAYRRENYELIKRNLHLVEIHNRNLHSLIEELPPCSIDAFNLSNVFEYTDYELFCSMLQDVVRCAKIGARLVYWNMMVGRVVPEYMQKQVRSYREESEMLHAKAGTFFYESLHIEEIEEMAGE